MKTMIINGKEIKTNYGGNYGFISGNYEGCLKKQEWVLEEGCIYRSLESPEHMLERLAKDYNRITFYLETCSIRGYYELVAKVRNVG